MSEGNDHLYMMSCTGGDPKSEPSPSSKIESSIIESMIWPFHSVRDSSVTLHSSVSHISVP